ncbi:MAG: ATP-grasp domain-containing protein [Gemmatimonadota bacterium]
MTPASPVTGPGAAGRLLVVQPSLDYAGRVTAHFPDAVLAAAPPRAAVLRRTWPHVLEAPLPDPAAAARQAAAWRRDPGLGIGGVACFVCEHLAAAAAIARVLQVPYYTEEQVQCTRHKERAAAAWRAAGVAVPESRVVASLEELLAFGARTRPPWILKPEDGTGSEWVLKVDTGEELAAADARLRAGLAERGLRHPAYLAQTFVQGREISADVYVDGDRLEVPRLTEKHLLEVPGQAGLVGAYYPSRADAAVRAECRDAYRRALDALGIRRGLVMVDGILAHGRLHLLEMGLRPGGDCLPDLCRSATGYDPVRAACQVALGQVPELPDWGAGAPVAALHLMADREGTVRRLDVGRLEADPRVLHVEVYHEAGESLRRWAGSYDDRVLAAAVVRCADPAQLPEMERALAGLIDLELEEDP